MIHFLQLLALVILCLCRWGGFTGTLSRSPYIPWGRDNVNVNILGDVVTFGYAVIVPSQIVGFLANDRAAAQVSEGSRARAEEIKRLC